MRHLVEEVQKVEAISSTQAQQPGQLGLLTVATQEAESRWAYAAYWSYVSAGSLRCFRWESSGSGTSAAQPSVQQCTNYEPRQKAIRDAIVWIQYRMHPNTSSRGHWTACRMKLLTAQLYSKSRNGC
jgi:hypothetical protein